MSGNLKNCPFCGRDGIKNSDARDDSDCRFLSVAIACPRCNCRGPSVDVSRQASKLDAVAIAGNIWNSRGE